MPNDNTNLIPPMSDEHVGFKLFAVADSIMKDKEAQGLSGKWTRNYELYKNAHWLNKSKKVSLTTANILFTHINRTTNMLTDNNPTFNIAKIGEVNEETEQIYQGLLNAAEHWWTDQEQQAILRKSVKNGEIYGCTAEKIAFNPDLEFGLGEIETVRIDPYYFGFYPVKQSDIQKCECIMQFSPMTIREVKRKWPKFAEHVKSDAEMLKSLGDTRREVQSNSTGKNRGSFLATIAGVVKNFINDASGAMGTDEEETLVIEAWVKDYTEMEDGSPLYPGYIRQITVCSGGEVVLEDRPNPSINPDLPPEEAAKTYLYDKFPFTFTHSNTDDAGGWGISDMEQLENLQIDINKTLSQFTTFKDKVSRPKLINPRDSGVKNQELTNMVGVLNPSSAMAGQGLRWLDSPNIPIDLLEGIKLYKELFFLVSGSFELEQAQTPGREVVAYKAIAALVERASLMLKDKIQNYGKMIRERGRMYISGVQNWYTEDRWITVSEDGEDQAIPIRGTDMIIPAKLTVVSGSTMPRSKVQEREEALELFAKGAIDAEELLKTMDWSNYKKVVHRMQQGPLGMFIEKLGEVGVPDAIMQYFQEIASMEDKEFEFAMRKEEIAPFMAVLQQSMQAGEGQDPEMPIEEQGAAMTAQAEVTVKQAQAEKVRAETQLVYEKIRTEQVEQEVKKAGVMFDSEKLKIERARTVSDIKTKLEQPAIDIAKEKAKADSKGISDMKGKSSEKPSQGPYREKGDVGMKTTSKANNKEV